MTALLVLNAGSSSLKFGLYRVASPHPLVLARGEVKGIGARAELSISQGEGPRTLVRRWSENDSLTHASALSETLGHLATAFAREELLAVGHRVVHGGADFSRPVLIDAEVLQKLEALTPLAPLHQPHNLAGVRAVLSLHPDLPQVACFDTAFHQGHADAFDRFAIPRALHDKGLRRYGFHGLSYEFIAAHLRERAPEIASGRVVISHLGAGASLCALAAGRSIDTTMGMTALDGLPMATRPGSIDPGLLLYLLKEEKFDADQLEDFLYHRCGWLGVSGLSADMRVLAESTESAAAQARALFALSVTKGIAAMAASLGGLDAVVFTAGIGEHDAALRDWIATSLSWLGVVHDPEANQAGAERFSRAESKVALFTIATDEEAMIARHTQARLSLA